MVEKFILKYDSQNQFKVLKESYSQINHAWNNKFKLNKITSEKINAVLIKFQ